jgi:hypothetical protein
MARFDLSQYATVEQRLRAFWQDEVAEDARIVTVNHPTDGKTWLIETRIYASAGDQANDLPKVTGWAQEANSDQFALERCETSSIGRALANWLWTGSKKLDGTPRPSRQEMEKVAKGEPQVTMSYVDYLAKLDELESAEDIRQLYTEARRVKAPTEVLEKIAAKGKSAK